MKKKRYLLGIILLVVVMFQLPVISSEYSGSIAVEAKVKNGLVKNKNTYYYYQNGKKVKNKWIKIKNKKYYFKSNGQAATGSYKVKGVYYIFKTNGQLYTPSKKSFVTVKAKKYLVSTKGKAVSGWVSGKKYYCKKNGAMVTGIQAINNTFYAFNAKGVQNTVLTKKLQAASNYEQDMTDLYALIGKPISSSYQAGCYLGSGKDGALTYRNFVVYTFRYDDGREIFMDVEAR